MFAKRVVPCLDLDRDRVVKDGYDLEMTAAVSRAVSIPADQGCS